MPESDNNDIDQDPLWERRARPGKRGNASQEKSTISVTPAQFKQQLLKYCQRQTKHNRSFCLAAIRILEYDQVARESGEHAAEQLSRLVQDVSAKYLRDADRITMPAPGRFLALLPDTDHAGAYRALNRIASSVASSKLHYKHKPLHASCSIQIASSEQVGSDPEALLENLGYSYDSDGKLQIADVRIHEVSHPTPFSGSFDVWFSRYNRASWNEGVVRREELEVPGIRVEQFEAIDTWQSQEPVIVQTVRQEDGTAFSAEQLEIIHKRARVAQHLDHPCITTVFDYHVKDQAILYLVREKLALAEPSIYMSDDHPDIAIMLDWLVQMCNALIYMQGVVPPIVPPVLDECLYIDISKGSPAIVDYELPYLLPDCYTSLEVTAQEAEAASQGRPVAAYRPVIESLASFMESVQKSCPTGCKRLADLIQKLRAEDLPKGLNTIFKIRAALTEVLEAEKLVLISGAEESHA
jgi:GGDEF domain-containing protein